MKQNTNPTKTLADVKEQIKTVCCAVPIHGEAVLDEQ